MKPNNLHRLAIGVIAVLAAGCATAPQSSGPATKPVPKTSAPAARPAAPATTKAPEAPTAPTTPVAPAQAAAPEAPAAPAKISPAAEAVVERLTHALDRDVMPHEVNEKTGFAAALNSLQPGMAAPAIDPADDIPQPPPRGLTADGNTTALVDRDWTGIVLVPINTSFSKAHTSAVKLTKVEAHPLNDGRARVWTRIRNTSSQALPAEIACTFKTRTGGEPPGARFYEFKVPAGAYRDVFFVSPTGDLVSYTVLIRAQ